MKNKTKVWMLLMAGLLPFNAMVYYGARQIASGFHHYDLSIPIDSYIPVLPWTIVIYWGLALVLWGINYFLCSYYDKSGGHTFLISHYIAETICFFFFLLLPATMERPVITDTTIWNRLLIMEYQMDKPDNLIPSIHCFASWLCWIGVRGNARIPKWYQYVSLCAAVAICVSTLTVKQHVIVDAAAGILVAELSYVIARYCARFYLPDRCKTDQ